MAYSNLDDFEYDPDPLINSPRCFANIQKRFEKIRDERVDHPSHYTRGRTEAIDVIEDAVADAPNPLLLFL